MAKIVKHSAALLRVSDDHPMSEGDAVSNSPGDHRKIELASTALDADGMLTIREIRKVRPEDVGLYVRPASVSLELSEEEASAFVPDLPVTPKPAPKRTPDPRTAVTAPQPKTGVAGTSGLPDFQ